MNRIKRLVNSFCREYKIEKPDEKSLCKALEKQGFTVVFFKTREDDPDVINVLTGLGLRAYAKSARGFTYADGDLRIVFCSSELSGRERLIVLSHEQGHISCGHLGRAKIVGLDVDEEHEAAEFSHYLLGKKPRPVWLIRAAVMLIAAAAIGAGAAYFASRPVYRSDVYVTDGGEKYHRRNCFIIKDKTNVHRLTEEEYESGEYSPCGICLPDED